MWVPVAVWQPCKLLYTCYLLSGGMHPLYFPASPLDPPLDCWTMSRYCLHAYSVWCWNQIAHSSNIAVICCCCGCYGTRDAAWELENNAYSDQLKPYSYCDVIDCRCPYGRAANLDDTDDTSVIVRTFDLYVFSNGALCLQCFDAVGWAAGRASGL